MQHRRAQSKALLLLSLSLSASLSSVLILTTKNPQIDFVALARLMGYKNARVACDSYHRMRARLAGDPCYGNRAARLGYVPVGKRMKTSHLKVRQKVAELEGRVGVNQELEDDDEEGFESGVGGDGYGDGDDNGYGDDDDDGDGNKWSGGGLFGWEAEESSADGFFVLPGIKREDLQSVERDLTNEHEIIGGMERKGGIFAVENGKGKEKEVMISEMENLDSAVKVEVKQESDIWDW